MNWPYGRRKVNSPVIPVTFRDDIHRRARLTRVVVISRQALSVSGRALRRPKCAQTTRAGDIEGVAATRVRDYEASPRPRRERRARYVPVFRDR